MSHACTVPFKNTVVLHNNMPQYIRIIGKLGKNNGCKKTKALLNFVKAQLLCTIYLTMEYNTMTIL